MTIASIFMLSCQNDTTNVKPDLNRLSELNLNFNQLKKKGWEVSIGDVYFSQFKNKMAKGTILFVTNETSEGLSVDKYYSFQQNESQMESKNFTHKIENGAILFRGDKLIVLDPHFNLALSYQLTYKNDSRSLDDMSDYINRVLAETRFSPQNINVKTGIGLAKKFGLDKRLNETKLNQMVANNLSLGELFISPEDLKAHQVPQTQRACDESAESCSIGGCEPTPPYKGPTSCSITCTDWYSYACCECTIHTGNSGAHNNCGWLLGLYWNFVI